MDSKLFFKKYNLLFHAAIMVALMLVIGNLPAPAPITSLGMRLLGIFAGVLYGWTTCGLLWTSLLGMCALNFSGLYTKLSEFWTISFGSETIVFIMFLFVFTAVLEEVGLIKFLANLLISFKFLNNKPWLFIGFTMIACCICASINAFATIIIFWEITYILADRFGFKPFDKCITLILIGIVVCATWGGVIMPYHPAPLVLIGTYQTLTGEVIDFFQYVCFTFPLAMLVCIFYTLVCRFIFRPDLKELKNINVSFVDQEALQLDFKQKLVLGFLLVFIFMILGPSILPKEWLLTQWIKGLGFSGSTILLIIALCLIKIDGDPVLNFKKAANAGMNWEVLFTLSFIIPFAGILTSDPTGIKDFILISVQPVLEGLSPIAFMVVALLIAAILTNFANNIVIEAIFVTLMVSFIPQLGLPLLPCVMALLVAANLSIATPVASPVATMMFSNIKWMKTKDIYRYSVISLVFLIVIILPIGWLWANIIF